MLTVETHMQRLERIVGETVRFFEAAMPADDVARVASLAADLMAKELTGETIAATEPTPFVRSDTHG